MKVFVTGATGFIGIPVVKELTAAGHKVVGLARSDAGAKAVSAAGGDVLRGDLENLDVLRQGAAAADAVIHLAFNHDFSKFQENCAMDGRAIEALGGPLSGTKKPLIVTGGLAGLGKPGRLATEDDEIPANFPFPRVSEQTALSLKNVSAAVMRLPQVHDPVKQGLISMIVPLAREKKASAYVGDGKTRWAAAHVSDVAKLYRLALEKHEAGARYHAVAEEGVTMKAIAEAIGSGLNVPVKSISAEEAQGHFGWLSGLASHDLTASSAKTRRTLGWNPTGPGLIADLSKMNYAG
jgi:nucleoside-diphosphate-sugar epimerase